MKTTIDIPVKELEDAIRFSGASTRREAVLKALADYYRRHRVEGAIKMFGTFTSMPTNDEIEAADMAEMKRRLGEA